LCFFSHDPDAFYNPDAIVYVPEKTRKKTNDDEFLILDTATYEIQGRAYVPKETTEEDVVEALSYIPSDDYETWIRIGMAIKAGDFPFHVWDSWSQQSSKYDPKGMEAKWSSFRPGKIGIATLFHFAKENGWTYSNKKTAQTATETAQDGRAGKGGRGGLPNLRMKLDKDGKPTRQALANVPNVIIMLQHWFGENLWYDEFLDQNFCLMMGKKQQWTDYHSIITLARLQQDVEGMEFISKNIVDNAVSFCLKKNRKNVLVDKLKALEWDKTERLDSWLIKYAGADDIPYVREVGRRFMIGAIARAFNPGIKFDHMLILEGEQGIGKSNLMRAFSLGFFCDSISKFDGKESAEMLRGVWVAEIAELEAMRKADVTTLKAFITRQTDRYRPAYERYTVDAPRYTVFCGTTNEENYLRDFTGNRRFWPVRCGVIDVDGFIEVRDQIFAEARHAFESGEDVLLAKHVLEDAQNEQERRLVIDEWQLPVMRFLSGYGQNMIAMTDLVHKALEIEPGRQTRSDVIRVGNVMKGAKGWQRARKKVDGTKCTVYLKNE